MVTNHNVAPAASSGIDTDDYALSSTILTLSIISILGMRLSKQRPVPRNEDVHLIPMLWQKATKRQAVKNLK